MNLGEKILDHYKEFLGDYVGADRYCDGDKDLQILGFSNVFADCIVFATFGLSNYPDLINNRCEVVLAVDDKFDECAAILANSVFYALSNRMDFGKGVLIGGADNIVEGFSESCGKTALYFTDAIMFPNQFSAVDDTCKIYMGFFVSEKEAEFFRQHGSDAFEDLLEKSGIDVFSLNRKSVL